MLFQIMKQKLTSFSLRNYLEKHKELFSLKKQMKFIALMPPGALVCENKISLLIYIFMYIKHSRNGDANDAMCFCCCILLVSNLHCDVSSKACARHKK